MSTEHQTGKPHDAGSLSGKEDILLSRVRRKLNRIEEMQEKAQLSLVLADRDAAMYQKPRSKDGCRCLSTRRMMCLMTVLSSTSTSVNGSSSPVSVCS